MFLVLVCDGLSFTKPVKIALVTVCELLNNRLLLYEGAALRKREWKFLGFRRGKSWAYQAYRLLRIIWHRSTTVTTGAGRNVGR